MRAGTSGDPYSSASQDSIALLRLGAAKVVFTQVGESAGHLHFRRATVDVDEGASSPWLAVKGGLSPGENVVVNGAILLSSME